MLETPEKSATYEMCRPTVDTSTPVTPRWFPSTAVTTATATVTVTVETGPAPDTVRITITITPSDRRPGQQETRSAGG